MAEGEKKGGGQQCKTMYRMTMNIAILAVHMLAFVIIVLSCRFLDILLRPLSQPRIISESIVGLFFSTIPLVRRSLKNEAYRTLNYIADLGMICHMFVIGLQVDPLIFLHLPVRETKVAGAGILTTLLIGFFVIPRLHIISGGYETQFDIGLSIILSGTASPLLTRLINDYKIGKSDIGQFVISSGLLSDLVTLILLSIGYIIFDPSEKFHLREQSTMLQMAATLLIQTILAAKLTPVLMNWVNHENPEGKSIKGPHLVLSVAYIVLVCSFSPTLGNFNKALSALLAGLFMPREGRISKLLVGKLNYFFITIFYPLFFFWVGTEAELHLFKGRSLLTWLSMISLFLIATAGKVLGTMLSGILLGFHLPDSIAIGLLLTIKGHFQVYLAIIAANMKLISVSDSIVMVIVTFLTITYTPLVVLNIIKRARQRSPSQLMALQWLSPTNELRVLLCIRGTQNIEPAINFIEISRGSANPGIMVYVTDMIELTDKIAATLAKGGVDALTVSDREVTEMRQKITEAVQAYLDGGGEGIGLRRMLALSVMNTMHQDISILAEDLLVSMIILPFHKDQEMDGRLNGGHSGFRHVNRKVLRNAPCSVGILVDRGLGLTRITTSSTPLNAAVIFIGGRDDREALAYSGRVAIHPGVKLTIIRFLLDSKNESATSRMSRDRSHTAEHDEEMKLDDEYFTEFYNRYVARGHVAYMEKYLVNSGQTFSTLRSLEGQYALFIVGRGGRVNSVLTAGMNDWEECPELGPIGDILSTADFSVTASVLIIQQHSIKGALDGLQDEFSIM